MRNRIKGHRSVRAGDLVPHELNPRTHSDTQRQALQALYEQIGFARSLLAYELPDGRLKLIDGHLRQSMDPEALVEVEVLDVDDEEARTLLLSIDPLAQLAGYNDEALEKLREMCPTTSEALTAVWDALARSEAAAAEVLQAAHQEPPGLPAIAEQYLILVECPDEAAQVALLERFQGEGLVCRALLS